MVFKRNFNVYGYKIDFYQTLAGRFVYINSKRLKTGILPPYDVYEYHDDEVIVKIKANGIPPLYMNKNLDVYINEELITEAVPLKFSLKSKKEHESAFKDKGNAYLANYEIEEAIKNYMKSYENHPDDYDLDFRLACCYSVMEDKKRCFYHINHFKSNAHNPSFRINREDKLAWYRMIARNVS